MPTDVGFAATKIVASATSPHFLVLMVLAAGTACLWRERTARAGRVVVASGVALLLLMSWAPFSDRVLRQHELRYPAVVDTSALPDSAWILVLGGGAVPDPRLPVTAWLTEASLARLVEGIRLHRAVPGSRLVVSGAAIDDSVSTAEAMARTAVALGVDLAAIVVEARPRNTAEEADRMAERAGGRPVVLVTSASHMPRAMMIFERRGLRVIPAPTNYLAPARDASLRRMVPSASNARKVEGAVYEWLARLRVL
ncbi:MAG TPA: ElyC/SanA/YdcF family protein [Longimicrobiales bacterium]|nr:ElyC/SanA/YdcF family protein [Longimicrobiales bacterium]